MLAWILLLGAVMPLPSLAQGSYPERPVTMIVPYAPGGAADIIARPLAAGLERELKQPFVVVNRGGASGAIGTQQVASAPPDGYTLLVAVVQMSILPEVDALSGRVPSYRREQLQGLARLTADAVVFMVGASSAWRSISELLADANRRPGTITYSTGGNYAGNHLPVAMFAQAAGIQLLSVPYKGGGPSMLAALSGEVAMTTQVPGVAYGHVASGRMRAIAHSGTGTLRDFPGVPSLKSLGYDVEFYLWAGFFAPRGLPANVFGALRNATRRVMTGDEQQRTSSAAKTELAYMDSDEFGKWWDADATRLIDTVRRMGRIE